LSIRPFRFGLFTYDFSSRQTWIEKARQVEDLGYDVLLVGDHVPFSFTPFQAMLSAADATNYLRLGSYVLANDFYNPVTLAREAATLDILSDGRFELGLGTGWYREDYRNLGIAFDSPGVRISRMEEAVTILNKAFSGEGFSFQGKFYNVEDFKLAEMPVQRPRPPLMIGGGGKRILSFAAREADIVGFNTVSTREGGMSHLTITQAATAEKVCWVRQTAGVRFDQELSIHFSVFKITKNRQEQEEKAANIRTNWGFADAEISLEDVLASPFLLIGSEDEMVEKLLRLREQFGITYLVFWEPLEDGARIIKRLKS
jgi:probable F420-dependent oxidoreductase